MINNNNKEAFTLPMKTSEKKNIHYEVFTLPVKTLNKTLKYKETFTLPVKLQSTKTTKQQKHYNETDFTLRLFQKEFLKVIIIH
jgi:hypothetical protein